MLCNSVSLFHAFLQFGAQQKGMVIKMKRLKIILSIALTLSLFVCSICPCSAFVEVLDNDILSFERAGGSDELQPLMATGCNSYNHYEVTSRWGNGYPKTIQVTTYYNGSVFDTYSVDYDETGDNSLPNFHGCQCPLCT